MDNKFKEEVIEEDIQIEEDEYEDDSKNNNKISSKKEDSENSQEDDDLMYEDEYESVRDDILKSMSLLSFFHLKICK